MEADSETGKVAQFYRRFRASRSFLLVLCTFIVVWVTLHFTRDFDPDWGALNLILSIEASIGMVLYMMVADRQDRFQRKQLEYMLHLIEAVYCLLDEHAATTEEDEHK